MEDELETWKVDRVGAAIEGRNPTVLAALTSSYAVIGDVQFLPGYCLALTNRRGVDRLSDLPRRERVRYLADVDLLATAVEQVCAARDDGYSRLNVEILGNKEPFLHAHIWPRYRWEPAGLRPLPVWHYPAARWADPATALSSGHDALRAALADEVVRLRADMDEDAVR